jgi:hypothetical protein
MVENELIAEVNMRNRISNVLWGLFFIIIGVGFAGNLFFDWDFHLFFDGWWTLFIIIPCLISMIQNGFGTASTIGFIIGVLLLAQYYEIETTEQDPAEVALYNKKYEVFQELYPTLKDIYEKMA